MTERGGSPAGSGSPVRPALALALTAAGFVALLIAGFGIVSLLTDTEVIGIPGLGAVPGAAAFAAATAAFAGLTWLSVRVPRPSFVSVVAVVAAVFLAYLAGLWAGALATGTDAGRATAAVGGFVGSPFAVMLAASAAVCAWVAVALVRTRASPPRWPWEDDDDAQ